MITPMDDGEKRATGRGQTESDKAAALPTATHKGILKIGPVEIPCFVLADGRRVLSGRGTTVAMGLTGRGQGMERFLASKSLQPYITESLRSALEHPIHFRGAGRSPLGYEAAILPELCNAVIDADEAVPLPPQQKHMARQARILIRGLATVGITALVDEATGYQEIRDRLALQKILESYISSELLAWAKRFPDEFYQELFRLRGWQYSQLSVKRPLLVGKLTNDVVYQRLAPGVLDELQKVTPRDEKGRTKHRFHQHLTTEVGHPSLERHLHAVIALMRASGTWTGFYRLLERSFPKLTATLVLPFPDEDNE